jgi:hypothetical protein
MKAVAVSPSQQHQLLLSRAPAHHSVSRPTSPAAARAAEELITFLDDLHGEAGFGENIYAFVKAGGIPVLVKFAVTGWPANGRVADSPHPYDKIVTCPELDDLHGETFQEVQILGLRPKNNGHYWRSPRRLAITALADMTNYM